MWPYRGEACRDNSLPWLECQKTDCCLPISRRNSGGTVDELPSPPCSSSPLISTGLFMKLARKNERGWKDRNPFVSLGHDYLHGDEGPECSAVFRCESLTIEPVFVLLQEVWEGQKRGEKKKKRGGRQAEGDYALWEPRAFASAIVVTELLSSTRVFSQADCVSLHPEMRSLDDGWWQVAWGTAASHKQVGVFAIHPFHKERYFFCRE